MENITLKAFRELSDKSVIYNEGSKTLCIKRGRLVGTYQNIEKASALELVKAN